MIPRQTLSYDFWSAYSVNQGGAFDYAMNSEYKVHDATYANEANYGFNTATGTTGTTGQVTEGTGIADWDSLSSLPASFNVIEINFLMYGYDASGPIDWTGQFRLGDNCAWQDTSSDFTGNYNYTTRYCDKTLSEWGISNDEAVDSLLATSGTDTSAPCWRLELASTSTTSSQMRIYQVKMEVVYSQRTGHALLAR